MHFYFVDQNANDANTLTIDPNSSETISKPSTGVYQTTIVSGTAGGASSIAAVEVLCVESGKWIVVGYTGVWN